MVKKNSKHPKTDSVKILVTLAAGTEEFRAYNRIKKKYHDEMAKRQKDTSDDVLFKTDLPNCELVRGSLFALDDVPQEELPDYIDAAWKPKGRPTVNTETDEGNETDSDADLDERATLLH